MSDIDAFYIPKHLDDPERWLFWTVDEALILIAPFFLGVMMDFYLIGIVMSITLYLLYKKFKSTGADNLIQYLIYWYFPKWLSGLKATPPSYIRTYIG